MLVHAQTHACPCTCNACPWTHTHLPKICMFSNVHTHACVYKYLPTCTHMSVYGHTCLPRYTHAYPHTHIYLSLHIHLSMYRHVSDNALIHACNYTHACLCTYTCPPSKHWVVKARGEKPARWPPHTLVSYRLITKANNCDTKQGQEGDHVSDPFPPESGSFEQSCSALNRKESKDGNRDFRKHVRNLTISWLMGPAHGRGLK